MHWDSLKCTKQMPVSLMITEWIVMGKVHCITEPGLELKYNDYKEFNRTIKFSAVIVPSSSFPHFILCNYLFLLAIVQLILPLPAPMQVQSQIMLSFGRSQVAPTRWLSPVYWSKHFSTAASNKTVIVRSVNSQVLPNKEQVSAQHTCEPLYHHHPPTNIQ